MRTSNTVLLIDLDNVLHRLCSETDPDQRTWLGPAEADALVSWILAEARAEQPTGVLVVAACPASTLDRYLGRAEFPHWLTLRLVPSGRDEADRLLLGEGMHFAQRGCRRLYLASGDNYFTPLATLPAFAGRTTVLIPYPEMLSRVLARLSGDVRCYQPAALADATVQPRSAA